MMILPLLLSSVGCTLPCPPLLRGYPDDRAIGGVTANDLIATLRQVEGPVALTWGDGATTTVTVSMEPERGTARLAQRASCVEGCVTAGAPALACGPDRLELQLTGTVDSADARLAEALTGDVTAERADGAIEWRSVLRVPLEGLQGSLDVWTVADRAVPEEGEVEILIFLEGTDEVLTDVQVDYLLEDDAGSEQGTLLLFATEL